jgi:hypothetical protein
MLQFESEYRGARLEAVELHPYTALRWFKKWTRAPEGKATGAINVLRSPEALRRFLAHTLRNSRTGPPRPGS